MNIDIIGANEHNLKNITVSIPRNKLVVVTGVSGSGKSTLAFDIIFNEAQRDYLQSVSTYARKSLPTFNRANVDSIEGLSPCIVINQKPLARNPRSTVGTVTEVYTFLRLLYSRLGQSGLSAGDFSFNRPSGECQACFGLGEEYFPDPDRLFDWEKSIDDGAILHGLWSVGQRNWNIVKKIGLFDSSKKLKDFTKDELNTLLYSEPVQYQNKETGYVQSWAFEGVVYRLRKRLSDARGQAGSAADKKFLSIRTCNECGGSRVNERARAVIVNGRSIAEIVTMELWELLSFIGTIKGQIADSIAPYITKVLSYLVETGLGYLTLNRSVATLSAGESQRVKLARQLGNALTRLIYVLDEPTSGLHARDIENLIKVLDQLVIKPNSVIVVEHDETVMRHADHIVDIGPDAGVNGGQIVFQGTPQEIINSGSMTGRYLSGKSTIQIETKRKPADEYLELVNANRHNLINFNVRIPFNVITCITGVSGSGKSTLVEILLKEYPKISVVDQHPVGKTSRSIPATYAGAFDLIRDLFASETGQNVSLFTFNGEGACPDCGGHGYHSIDMHFLGSIPQLCETCQGKRYKSDTLSFRYKGKNIADVLNMTVIEALAFFNDKGIQKKLKMLSDVGLGYLGLGQPLDTLSGGEAQRVKIAKHLAKKKKIYVLDEPTRGLHSADIAILLELFTGLVNKKNTVIVIEHNLDIIKNADWVIDLGPEGGKNGGKIIAEGPPESIAQTKESHTGKYLKKHFKKG